MTSSQESNGPDPTRGSIHCTEFHQGQALSGTSQKSSYNCCCCDPCKYVRPMGEVGGKPPVPEASNVGEYCCKCIPRVLMLVFEPDDPEDECCNSIGVPMFAQTPVSVDLYHFYVGELFGVTVTIQVGRVISGTGSLDDCGWKITTDVGESGSGAGDSQEFPIDHSDVTCLFVPDGIDLAEVEGPAGCTGHLVLYDVDKAKVPFQYVNYPIPDGNFIDLSGSPCGECTEVPALLCVYGQRHENGEVERRTFEWFDDTEGITGERGWGYYNPVTEQDEKFLLSDDSTGTGTGSSNGCIITPILEDGGAEHFQPQSLFYPCSCQLYMEFGAEIGGNPYAFELRAGPCSCWDFHCGTCRCVPLELCAMLWDGAMMHTDLHLMWQPETKSWDSDDGSLRLVLRSNGKYQCEIVPVVWGEVAEMSSYPVWECGDETITGQFTGENDVLSVSGFGQVSRVGTASSTSTSSGTSNDVYIWFNANSLTSSCLPAPCFNATPCYDECGSHPTQLTVTITQWTAPGDASGIEEYQYCIYEITVYLYQQITGFTDEGPTYECGYIGFTHLEGYDHLIMLLADYAGLYFSEVPAWQFGDPRRCVVAPSIYWSPSCDPVYWDSGDLSQDPSPIDHVFDKYACGSCTPDTGNISYEDTYHLQIVVTE